MIVDSLLYVRSDTNIEFLDGRRIKNVKENISLIPGCKFEACLKYGKGASTKRLVIGSPGKTRTCNLLVNSQTLLPIELPGSAYNSVSNFKEQCNQLPGLSLQPIPLHGNAIPLGRDYRGVQNIS